MKPRQPEWTTLVARWTVPTPAEVLLLEDEGIL